MNPMRFTLNSFPLQNLVDSQLWSKDRVTQRIALTPREKESLMMRWADDRIQEEGIFIPSSSSFRTDPSQFLPAGFELSKPIAVLFTSSSSEYDFFNDSHHSWKSQAEALGYACDRLRAAGYSVILRFHPNQFNWSWFDFHDIYKRCRESADFVIFPWDFISSYSLLGLSKLVVVWESTIGLEALMAGKRVVCLKPTPYNISTSIKLLGNEKTLDLWLSKHVKDLSSTQVDSFLGLACMIGIGTKLNLYKLDYCSRLAKICDEFESLLRTKKSRHIHMFQTARRLAVKSQFLRHWRLLAPKEILLILEFFMSRAKAIKVLERLSLFS